MGWAIQILGTRHHGLANNKRLTEAQAVDTQKRFREAEQRKRDANVQEGT